jgi:hypothetical protein
MGSPLGLERVPLTEAEIEHLAPIVDRWEAAQKEMQAAQRDVDAVIKLYRAQHKQELTEGPEWQLSRDAFVRQMPPRVEQPVNGDGELERQVAALMEG